MLGPGVDKYRSSLNDPPFAESHHTSIRFATDAGSWVHAREQGKPLPEVFGKQFSSPEEIFEYVGQLYATLSMKETMLIRVANLSAAVRLKGW